MTVSRSRLPAIILTLLVSLILAQGVQTGAASGEQFSLSVMPAWATEGSSAGVHLVLYVSNAQLGTYTFNWTVIDPSGKPTSVNKNTLSTTSTWNQTASYPSDFTGSLNLVGNYSVNVAEVLPSINSSVERATFEVGLTDNPKYERSAIIHVNGAGYLPLDTVNVTLTLAGVSVTGFPLATNATATGAVAIAWQTYPNTTLGNYRIQFTGKNTPAKTPTDSQTFIIYPTNTTTSLLLIGSASVQRTQALHITLNATYLNGQPATTGTAHLQLTEPNGVTTHQINSTYDSTTKSYATSYLTTLSTNVGVWTVGLGIDGFNDGFGNGGPSSPVASTFSVQLASLNVSTLPYTYAFGTGGIIVFGARVLTPSAANFNVGSVTATLSNNGMNVAAPIDLVYDQNQGQWSGSYKVGSSDPTGTWILALNARDLFGNSGHTEALINVSTGGGQSALPFGIPTWAWLATILGLLGVGFGTLIFRRRSGFRHQKVKLDLEAIHRKADEVKGDDFLQSIQAQLKRRTERIAKEKEQAK